MSSRIVSLLSRLKRCRPQHARPGIELCPHGEPWAECGDRVDHDVIAVVDRFNPHPPYRASVRHAWGKS